MGWQMQVVRASISDVEQGTSGAQVRISRRNPGEEAKNIFFLSSQVPRDHIILAWWERFFLALVQACRRLVGQPRLLRSAPLGGVGAGGVLGRDLLLRGTEDSAKGCIGERVKRGLLCSEAVESMRAGGGSGLGEAASSG